jgi:hypothetical protein
MSVSLEALMGDLLPGCPRGLRGGRWWSTPIFGELIRDRLHDPDLARSFCKSATTHLKAVKERIDDLRRKEERAKHVIQTAFDMVVEGRTRQPGSGRVRAS